MRRRLPDVDYRQEGLGKNKGLRVRPDQNPTREALERNVAALGGDARFAFGSGLAALDAILKLSGRDHIVSGESVYGGRCGSCARFEP